MDNIVEVILRVRDQASAALAQVQRAAGDVRRSLGEVQRGLEGLGSSLGAVLGTGGLAYALSSAARAAQEAESSMRVLANTARAVGVDYDRLSASLNQVLEPLGVLPEQAASAAAQLLRAGFSVEQIAAAFQAGAASALAAGKTAAQGIENVAMALSTGQSIYLNYIGIAENIGPVLNKVASSMKGASEEAIRQAQNQAALNVILKATAQEVTSLPDLLTGLTGATNRFNLELYQLKVTIGQQVRPVLTALYQIGADLLGMFRNLDPAVRQSITTWTMATTAVTGLATAVGMLLPVIRNAATVLLGLGRTLLWLVTSPIGLVVSAVALLAREWINMSGSAEDARRKLYILGQALWGLVEVARGVVQAMSGLLANLGNGLAAIARAFLRVIQGDFAGAWREIQNTWNLEGWAARFTAANESIRKGLTLLGSSFRGEVRPEVEKTGRAIEDLVARWQAFFNAARRQGEAAPTLPPLPGLDAGAGAGTGAEKLAKTRNAAEQLRDSLTALKQLYELGRISAEQYAQGLRLIYERALELERRFPQLGNALRDVALDAKKGLEDLRRAAEEEGRRISDALLRVAQDIAAAKAESWAMAWEMRFPSPDTLRGRLNELRQQFELGRIPADEYAAALRAIYERALELEGMFPAMAAGYRDVAIQARNAADAAAKVAAELATAIPDSRRAVFAAFTPPPEKLREEIAALQRLFALGRISSDEFAQGLQEIYDRAAALEEKLPRLAAGYQEVQVAAQSAIRSIPAQKTALDAIPVIAEGALETVRSLIGVLGADELRKVIEANIAFLTELQQRVPAGTEAYAALDSALAKLRQTYIELFPAVRVAHEEIFVPAEDYYDVVAGVKGYREELEKLLDAYEKGAISQEEFSQQLAELRDDLLNMLLVWGRWIDEQERAGVVMAAEREALAKLSAELENLGARISAIDQKKLLDIARSVVEFSRSAVGALGADDLREAIETNIAVLIDLQQRVPEYTDAYRALGDAIAELRLKYLTLFPAVRAANEEIFVAAEDYYNVAVGAKEYREELDKLLDNYERGIISQEEFKQKLAELQDDLQGILPVWRAWVAEQEATGKNMAAEREALAKLSAELEGLGERIDAIDQKKLRDLAKGVVEATRSFIGRLGADDLQKAIEANIALLLDLQQQVPEGTDAYRALAAAIAELRLEYLRLFPAVRVAHEEVFTPAENYYDVEAGAKAYREELEELLNALEKGAISQEEFNEKFAQLLDNLQAILPVWEDWVAAMEEAGVNTTNARQALSALNEELARTQERIRAIEQTRLDRWVSDLTNAIQAVNNAISSMLDAFTADTFGRGLAQFARGLSDLIGLIPGGRLIGGLVSAIGGLLGRIWDGIASVFDSGWGKVQERLKNAASRFTLISTDAFAGAIERYQERYLFGLIRVTKYRINETFLAMAQSIASALEGGILNGVKRAAAAFLRGAVEWAELLRQGIREAIENAVIEAVIQGAVIRGALGKLLDQLVAALASGDYSLARGLIRQIAAAVPGLVSALEGVLTPFRNALESAFPSDALTGPGVRAIQYQLPTVFMGAPAWVSEMGRHVERFGLYIEDLVERGIRVQVVGTDWVLREVAV